MVVSLAEAAVLAGHIGMEVEGVVVDIDPSRDVATVQLLRPSVVADLATADAALGLGDEVRLRVVAADPQDRTVRLELVSNAHE
jgi:exoribonuclease R